MPERLKAFPTLESRRRIAQRVRDMPNNGGLDLAWPPVVEDVEGAEEKSTGPLTQYQHDEISKVAKVIKDDKKQTSNRVPKGFFRNDKILNHRLIEAGEKEYLVRWFTILRFCRSAMEMV
jgi:hypothetical protein